MRPALPNGSSFSRLLQDDFTVPDAYCLAPNGSSLKAERKRLLVPFLVFVVVDSAIEFGKCQVQILRERKNLRKPADEFPASRLRHSKKAVSNPLVVCGSRPQDGRGKPLVMHRVGEKLRLQTDGLAGAVGSAVFAGAL